MVKERKKKNMRDYRGIKLMRTLYKLYTAVLTKRLRKDIEEEGILPANQTGFKKGLGTMDNIFTLNL